MKRRVFGLLAALAVGVPAASGETLPVSTSPALNAPDLGKVMTGASSSTFSISATGAVTRLSGTAVRITPGGATVPTVTITCGSQGHCNNGKIDVTITAASTSRAAISQLAISDLTCGGAPCTPTNGPTPGAGPSLGFTVDAPGKNRTVTFKVPMQVTLAATSATGTAPYAYTVVATLRN